jgi:hypothetical protein
MKIEIKYYNYTLHSGEFSARTEKLGELISISELLRVFGDKDLNFVIRFYPGGREIESKTNDKTRIIEKINKQYES